MSAEWDTVASQLTAGAAQGHALAPCCCTHGKHPTPSTPPPPFTAGDAATLRGLPAVFGSVSRVMHAGASIGTAVRVATFGDGTGNIVLTARHCIEEGGACLHDLSAFRSALRFVAARADLDVAVFRGRRGPGLWLRQWTLLPGEWLGVASFPLAVNQELAADDASLPPGGAGGAAAGSAGPVMTTAAEVPTVDTCVLSKISATGLRGIASANTGT